MAEVIPMGKSGGERTDEDSIQSRATYDGGQHIMQDNIQSNEQWQKHNQRLMRCGLPAETLGRACAVLNC